MYHPSQGTQVLNKIMCQIIAFGANHLTLHVFLKVPFFKVFYSIKNTAILRNKGQIKVVVRVLQYCPASTIVFSYLHL